MTYGIDIKLPNLEAAQSKLTGAGIQHGTPVRVKRKLSWWHLWTYTYEEKWGNLRATSQIKYVAFPEGGGHYAAINAWLQGR